MTETKSRNQGTRTLTELVAPVLERLSCVKMKGPNSWKVLCPCHDDNSPSLEINLSGEKGGILLIHCHACGANGTSVMNALKLPTYGLYALPLDRDKRISSCGDDDLFL